MRDGLPVIGAGERCGSIGNSELGELQFAGVRLAKQARVYRNFDDRFIPVRTAEFGGAGVGGELVQVGVAPVREVGKDPARDREGGSGAFCVGGAGPGIVVVNADKGGLDGLGGLARWQCIDCGMYSGRLLRGELDGLGGLGGGLVLLRHFMLRRFAAPVWHRLRHIVGAACKRLQGIFCKESEICCPQVIASNRK